MNAIPPTSTHALVQVALSYGQRRLWALDKVEDSSSVYNIPLSFRLAGPVNPGVLAQSLLCVMERHETLRTIIREGENGEPVGYLMPIPSEKEIFSFVDLRMTSPEHRTDLAKEKLSEISGTHFNLGADYPVRATLLQLEDTLFIFSVVMHHHAADGVSLGLFCRDLSEAYEAKRIGSPPGWQELDVQYSDWADWQQETIQAELRSKVDGIKTRHIKHGDSV